MRQARAGTTVASVLVDSGAVTEDEMARATAERHGLDHIDLAVYPVDSAAAGLIQPSAAKRYMAVPVGFEPDGSLIVAVSDPADVLGLNDIAVMTKLDVTAAVAPRSAIEALVLTLEESAAPEAAPTEGKRKIKASGRAETAFAEPAGAPAPTPAAAAPEQPTTPSPPPAPPAPAELPPRAIFWQAGDGAGGTTSARPPQRATAPAPAPVATGDQAVLDSLRQQLDRAREERTAAQLETGRLQTELTELRQQAAAAGSATEELTRSKVEIERLTAASASVGDARADLERLRAELERVQAEQAAESVSTEETERLRGEVEQLRATLERLRPELEAGQEARTEVERLKSEVSQLRTEQTSADTSAQSRDRAPPGRAQRSPLRAERRGHERPGRDRAPPSRAQPSPLRPDRCRHQRPSRDRAARGRALPGPLRAGCHGRRCQGRAGAPPE